jgi:hypothetical protein
MKKQLWIICVWFTLSGCAGVPYTEIGLGINGRITTGDSNWEETDELGALIRAGVKWDQYRCGWTHLSHPLLGPPFNDEKDEDTADHFGCSWYREY